ncbi:MAG TPA: phosphoglycerate kinase [Anaerolineae bacterium]|nr:phosphoglycerate kinase [Anaerolineae bacterium]
MRVDFNVPLQDGAILDDRRILAALPTMNYLIEHGASIVLCSHLGRPKGKADPSLSLRPVYERLRELMEEPVHFASDCVGPLAEKAVSELKKGEILLLENTRFHAGETSNDPDFAAQLASLGEIFVNDAFGTAHRSHASNVGVAKHLPAVAGFLIEKELAFLGEALEDPEHPYIAILGGSKIADKIGVVTHLLERCDLLLVGGGIANSFLESKGLDLGASRSEPEVLRTAADLLARDGNRIKLPVDLVVADKFAEDAEHKIVDVDQVPEGWWSLDIGPQTIESFTAVLEGARTVVWNGPMGVYEFQAFSKGTIAIAHALAQGKGMKIVGGGSSADAVSLAGVEDQIDHVSTGGGASLRMLEGRPLPGVSVLLDKQAPLPVLDEEGNEKPS